MNLERNGKEVYLQPGEVYFGSGSVRLRTVLGSCVAVTLWHPGYRLGGMCHFMLPRRAGAASDELDGRYADEAVQWLLRHAREAGTQPADYQTKLFGAGNMFPLLTDRVRHDGQAQAVGPRRVGIDIPALNAAAVRDLTAAHRLDVRAADLGGNGYRQVLFDLRSGRVWCRQVPAQPCTGGPERDVA